MSVISNYKKLIECIKVTCKNHNKNYKNINIVAVSKQQDTKKINLLLECGHICFGENRLDETLSKLQKLDKGNMQLHYIGALQSKKIKEIIKIYDVIETLDTESSAKKLSILQSRNFKIPEIFIQVNIGAETQKRGVNPSDFSEFLDMCQNKYNLKIIGAMCMPPINKNPKPYFENMLMLCKSKNIKNISMGMSKDYKQAIISGATNIRIGSFIFGERDNKK